jgi:glycosyltransferase involved in cell wall biosynthesis
VERMLEVNGLALVSTPLAGEALVSICAVLTHDLDRIDHFLAETTKVLTAECRYHELLLIDNALDWAVGLRVQDWQHRTPNIRLLRLSRRCSHEIALAAALDNSIGDYVVVMNIDSDPPLMIPDLIKTAMSGHDVVIAERVCQDDPVISQWLSRAFYYIATILLGYPLRSNATYFRAFSRRAVNSLIRIRSKNRYLRCLNGMVGFSQATIPHSGRVSASGRWNLLRLLADVRSAADIIISNSAAPLRFASLLGLLASFGNVLYFGYILAVTIVKRKLAEGWLTISVTTTTMFLLLFIILSILSEYVARILDEAKEQPLYFIEAETDSDVCSFEKSRLNVI